jgi:hypothetical protein
VAGYNASYAYNQRLLSARPLLFPPIGNGAWVVTWHEKFNPIEAVKTG